jgi:hypothetical protein
VPLQHDAKAGYLRGPPAPTMDDLSTGGDVLAGGPVHVRHRGGQFGRAEAEKEKRPTPVEEASTQFNCFAYVQGGTEASSQLVKSFILRVVDLLPAPKYERICNFQHPDGRHFPRSPRARDTKNISTPLSYLQAKDIQFDSPTSPVLVRDLNRRNYRL